MIILFATKKHANYLLVGNIWVGEATCKLIQ